MDIITQLLLPGTLLFLVIGSVLGLFIGALPGLSATMGVAILTPMTFWLPPEQGLAMLISIYCTAIFAGGIPAILVNTPGTPASMVTAFDGYPLTLKGKGGLALGINAIYSGLGGIISVIFLILAAQPIAAFALHFGAAEYFALAVFGLSMMISISGKSIRKGIICGFLGLFIATVGLDPMTSTPRFTFDQTYLYDGVSFIPIMIGLFGIGEVFYQISSSGADFSRKNVKRKIGRILPLKKERKEMRKPFWFSALISPIIGAIPGAGGDIASIVTWEQSKRFSKGKKKEEYGKGSLGGLAATTTANNGVIGGAFTTMLTLGLPGDAVTAILIGSLMMYGMQPGPNLFLENPDIVHTIMGLLLMANILVIVIGLIGANLFSRIMLIRKEYIWLSVILFCVIGAYALNNSYFDVWIVLACGIIGFLFRRLDYPLGPLILGLILGPMAEANFRRALVMSPDQPYAIFFTRPIALILLTIAVLSLCWPLFKKIMVLFRSNKQRS
ncbi:tripartite tricarboxylate transporter permease [Salipaludibacillus agaradhaerens]|uniref:tripartite tricarboxylate transporter permease n=1 Tax=Salipaludibacillus agaradhaerens TaxID=76935 RepID=UPI0021518AEB|nr:tripartite tricarboxylate transporter permease [Salipaludibacillus agaradhaerens]MCR6106066.1 tripartite tricarboxylate transporter permease [Salipaludibacillus agaradhaerens]MCR6118099.1 tripartite tricarboxylate transporter permease [Salipaludibacillus agaradhaerens]